MKSFLLKPSGKDYIWGGTRLKSQFHKELPLSPLAETWECSVHPDGPSFAASGELRGWPLPDVLAAHPEYLGTSPSVQGGGLHLLVKLIDAKENLSVQVHPDDAYAYANEGGQEGKTEMWYVVDAAPGARLVFGLNRMMTPESLRSSLKRGSVESCLRYVPVRKNDVFFIPAGTIHAIGQGALIAEIQQSSNLTYRLYDYGRLGKDGRPRELHVDKALDVADLSGAQNPRQPMRVLRYKRGFAEESLCKCPFFEVDRCLLNGEGVVLPPLPESYRVLLCLEGAGCFYEGDTPLHFHKGDTIFIPATADELEISGGAEFLLIRG